MKIVNEKGKLFGIINPIDLIVLLALVIVAVAAVVKFLPPELTQPESLQQATTVNNAPAPSPENKSVPMQATLRIRGAMPAVVSAIQATQPGTKLVTGDIFAKTGTVVSVKVEPYTYTIANAEGVSVSTVDPVKKDVIVVIEGTGSPSDPVHVIANQEVRAGRDFIFKTNLVEVTATVESVIFNG